MIKFYCKSNRDNLITVLAFDNVEESQPESASSANGDEEEQTADKNPFLTAREQLVSQGIVKFVILP